MKYSDRLTCWKSLLFFVNSYIQPTYIERLYPEHSHYLGEQVALCEVPVYFVLKRFESVRDYILPLHHPSGKYMHLSHCDMMEL